MSNFSRDDVQYLKRLCRMGLSEEEELEFVASLQKILDHVELLQEIDTTGVAACSDIHRAMLKNKTRADEIKDVLAREEFLAEAPDQIGGMVRVPPVLRPQ